MSNVRYKPVQTQMGWTVTTEIVEGHTTIRLAINIF